MDGPASGRQEPGRSPLELGGECDDPRILAQLQETALQFPHVQQVAFYLEGKPLTQLVSGRG